MSVLKRKAKKEKPVQPEQPTLTEEELKNWERTSRVYEGELIGYRVGLYREALNLEQKRGKPRYIE